MITLEKVAKDFGKFKLHEITTEIPEGYICGLAGRNGAGKTTLLNLMLGLLKPEDGELTIDGMRYEEEEKAIRNLLGCVLVDELFLPAMSLKDNAEYFGQYYEAYDAGLYEKYLSEFHLVPGKKFKALSKGEKLKCQFAFALAHHPKYLLLDEPTANFDPEFRKQFWEIVKAFIADGAHSVLLATHLTEDLDRMADYLLLLENGELVVSGDIESFRDRYRIVSGEDYLIRNLPKDWLIGSEMGTYGTKALVKNKKGIPEELVSVPPSIEEFMYYSSERRRA